MLGRASLPTPCFLLPPSKGFPVCTASSSREPSGLPPPPSRLPAPSLPPTLVFPVRAGRCSQQRVSRPGAPLPGASLPPVIPAGGTHTCVCCPVTNVSMCVTPLSHEDRMTTFPGPVLSYSPCRTSTSSAAEPPSFSVPPRPSRGAYSSDAPLPENSVSPAPWGCAPSIQPRRYGGQGPRDGQPQAPSGAGHRPRAAAPRPPIHLSCSVAAPAPCKVLRHRCARPELWRWCGGAGGTQRPLTLGELVIRARRVCEQ